MSIISSLYEDATLSSTSLRDIYGSIFKDIQLIIPTQQRSFFPVMKLLKLQTSQRFMPHLQMQVIRRSSENQMATNALDAREVFFGQGTFGTNVDAVSLVLLVERATENMRKFMQRRATGPMHAYAVNENSLTRRIQSDTNEASTLYVRIQMVLLGHPSGSIALRTTASTPLKDLRAKTNTYSTGEESMTVSRENFARALACDREYLPQAPRDRSYQYKMQDQNWIFPIHFALVIESPITKYCKALTFYYVVSRSIDWASRGLRGFYDSSFDGADQMHRAFLRKQHVCELEILQTDTCCKS